MNGNQKPDSNQPGRLRKGKLTLREIQDKPQSTAGGAFALRTAYLSNRIHRGSDIWLNVIGPKEREWAAYLGYDSLEATPIADREYIRLWVSDWLLVAFYCPSADIPNTVKEIRAALNTLERMTRELVGKKREKPIQTPQEILAQLEGEENEKI